MHSRWANAGFPHRRDESFFQCGLGHCLHAHAVRAESLAPPRTRTTARHCLAAQQSVTTARETCCKTGPAMPRASRRAQRLRRGATLAHASAVTTKWRTAGRLSHALRRACLARVLQNTRQRWCRLAATNRRQEGWPVSGPRVRRHCCARASPCRRGELLRGRGTSTHAPWPTRRNSFGSTKDYAAAVAPSSMKRAPRGGVVPHPGGNYAAAGPHSPNSPWATRRSSFGPARKVFRRRLHFAHEPWALRRTSFGAQGSRSKTIPPRCTFSSQNMGRTAE